MNDLRPMVSRSLFCLSLFASAVACANEYVVPPGDVAGFFAELPKDATVVSFSAADTYYCEGDIVLPPRRS